MTRMRSLLFIILVKIRPYSFVKIVMKKQYFVKALHAKIVQNFVA